MSVIFVSLLITGIACTTKTDDGHIYHQRVIGPVTLGTLFDRMQDGEKVRGTITDAGGPEIADIIDNLNKCEVFVVDPVVRRKDSSVQLAKKRPEILVSGGLSFKRIRNGTTWHVNLHRISISSSHTQLYTDDAGRGPFRRLVVIVELHVTRIAAGLGESFGVVFLAPPITFGLDGKLALEEGKKK